MIELRWLYHYSPVTGQPMIPDLQYRQEIPVGNYTLSNCSGPTGRPKKELSEWRTVPKVYMKVE
jgi:hypothetical protein